MRTSKRSGSKVEKETLGQNIFSILKGTLLAVIFSMVCILIFALIIKFANLEEGIIPPVNQVVKMLSIVIGSGYVAKTSRDKGWLKGSITGLIYIIFGFMLFSLVDGQMNINRILLSDTLSGVIVGFIGGVIGANLK